MKADMTTVKRLVHKDWSLHQKMIASYVGGGILGLAIMGYPHSWALYMGCIVLLTIMVSAGGHAISLTIIGEKKDQTTPFIISLPVRPSEYVLGKIIVNLLIFLIPWMTVVLGVILLVIFTPIPDGILPFLLVICFLIIMNYALNLSITLLTESEGWFIFSMVLLNLAINPFIMLTVRNPDFYQYFESEQIVWPDVATVIIVTGLLVAVFSLAGTIFRQARRVTFI